MAFITVRARYRGEAIILGRCPSLSAHESESMLRAYLVCREREKQANGTWKKQCTNNSDPVTPELLPRQSSVSLRMLTNLRLADLASDHCATRQSSVSLRNRDPPAEDVVLKSGQ
jgi:hypothetical protein